MQSKESIKIKSHNYYVQRYYKKLSQPQSVVQGLTSLCGGWYLETFKQVINKLNKNKSSPLPLFFASPDNMEPISKNKQLLRTVFKLFDTRGYNKIDACELYSSCLALSKGSYQTYLKTVVDIFGFQNTARINRNEFFFFIDSFYRALPKILVTRTTQKAFSELNIRLDYKQINKFIEVLYEDDKTQIERNQIYEAMMKLKQLNEFLRYVQNRCVSSAENSRNNAIEKIKIETEVRKCIVDIILEVHNKLEPKN